MLCLPFLCGNWSVIGRCVSFAVCAKRQKKNVLYSLSSEVFSRKAKDARCRSLSRFLRGLRYCLLTRICTPSGSMHICLSMFPPCKTRYNFGQPLRGNATLEIQFTNGYCPGSGSTGRYVPPPFGGRGHSPTQWNVWPNQKQFNISTKFCDLLAFKNWQILTSEMQLKFICKSKKQLVQQFGSWILELDTCVNVALASSIFKVRRAQILLPHLQEWKWNIWSFGRK